MVSQAAMRGQRVVESECRCWNLAVWVLVTLLGSLFLVAVSVLMRLGECVCVCVLGGGGVTCQQVKAPSSKLPEYYM